MPVSERLKKWWPALLLLAIGIPATYYIVNVVLLNHEKQRRIAAGLLDAGLADGIHTWADLNAKSKSFQAYRTSGDPAPSSEPASGPSAASGAKTAAGSEAGQAEQTAASRPQTGGSGRELRATAEVAGSAAPVVAEPVEPAELPKLRGRPLDVTFLPPNPELVVSIRVAELVETPLVKNLLVSGGPTGQPAVDQIATQFGVAPGEIETLVVGVTGLPGPPPSAPTAEQTGVRSPTGPSQAGNGAMQIEAVVVVHTLAAYDQQKVLSSAVEGDPIEQGGRAYYRLKIPLGAVPQFLFLANPQTLVMGSESAIQSTINRGRRPTALPPAMRTVNASYHVAVAILPKDASLLGAASAFAPGEAEQGLSSALAQHATALALSAHASDRLVAQLAIRCKNRTGAEKVAQAADQALAALRESVLDPSGGGPLASVFGPILGSTTLNQNGATVEITAAIPSSAFDPQNLGPAMMPLMMTAGALSGANPFAAGTPPGAGTSGSALAESPPAGEATEPIAAREPRSGPPRVVVDVTKGAFSWWSPQTGPQFDPDQPHRGTDVVKYFQQRNWPVRELSDDADLIPALDEADIAIRFGDSEPYTPEEVAAYDRFVQSGGALLLLASYRVADRDDPLADAFGIHFSGRINGGIISQWADQHPVTRRLEGIALPFASEVTAWPDSATILGSVAGEDGSKVVLGALEHGHGTVVFLSCESLLFEMPQPLMDRVFDFLSGDLKVESRSDRGTVLKAKRIDADFPPDTDLTQGAWASATPVRIERETMDGSVKAELATTVRALWSKEYLYLAFEAPYTELTTAQRPNVTRERRGLSDNDVVQVFLSGPNRTVRQYHEFQVAPNGEWADSEVKDSGDDVDLYWNSGFDKAAKINEQEKVWTAVMRIPLSKIQTEPPQSGDRWRINLFRVDQANDAVLAWNPTRNENLYEARRFGTLVFQE